MTLDEFERELKSRISQKLDSNPHLSIRSIAKSWDVVESTLQKIVRGERKLGPRFGAELAAKLDVRLLKPESQAKRKMGKGWKKLLSPTARPHVSWLNLSILEMLKLKSFKPDSKWIADRLGLPVTVVSNSLDEMESFGMLRRDGDHWVDLVEDASTGASGYRTTSEVLQMHQSVLRLSEEKLKIPFEQRDHGFSILPVAKKDLSRLKKRIQTFRWELCEMAQNSKSSKDQIYLIQIGFVPITKEADA